LLAATHLVFVVEFGLVLAIAFSVRLLHRRLEFVATQMFYKDRLDGQARLARATAALHHAESRETIAELLIAEALEALKLSSAALFVHKGDHFERESSLGWEDEDASEISDSDPVVGHLRTRCGALDLTKIHWTHAKLPFNSLKPLIAEPIIAHDRVMAFTLYGGREAGDAFASEELQSLDALADAAAASYDHIRSKELEAQNAALLAQQLRLRNELARIKAPKRPL
jgi:GAF domain-containing protein